MAPIANDGTHEIRDAYKRFADALSRADGIAASEVINSKFAERYEVCRKLALESSGIDFDSLGQFDVILIFQLRYHLTESQLQSMNGHDLIRWGVESGLTSVDTVRGVDLDQIHVDGDIAYATLRKNGQVIPNEGFRFVNEGDHWRLDLDSVIRQFDAQLDIMRQQAHKSKTELAVYLLEKKYGKPIPLDILRGPLNSTNFTPTAVAAGPSYRPI